ncbi:MAG: hypothetical protein DRN57_08210 [Thermoplasmata archaeon]|nr:MAG: hypothetical protein DRN57_08210 [Thermoplasmata archaeon]
MISHQYPITILPERDPDGLKMDRETEKKVQMKSPRKSIWEESESTEVSWKVDLDDENVPGVMTPFFPLRDDRDGYIVMGRSASAHRKWRRKGLLELGAVGEHQKGGEDLFGRKVLLDAAFPHIIFICGKRGSGKSYTLGIFAEELMRSAIGVGVIIVDPIGIFWSLRNKNRSRKEKEILRKWGLQPHSFPEVKVLVPEGSMGGGSGNYDGVFSISVGDMHAEDWCQVFDVDRFRTQGLLIGTVIEEVRNGYESMKEGRISRIKGKGARYSIEDMVSCIETSMTINSRTGGFTPQTRRSMIARFNAANGWGIFSMDGTPLKEITSPNRATVLDVSDPRLGDEKRSLITGIIARKVLSARIHTVRKEEMEDYDEVDEDTIPVTWLLIDEAHIILPHGRQTPATEALVEYAKQGRRPGCALVLATQRPASTSDEILSQVDILLGHNLALEDDMNAMRRRVPAKLPSEFSNSDFIRAIPVGTAIMADQRTQQRSFLLRMRPRFSHHGGSSAMPRAFSDRTKKRKKPPVSARASDGGVLTETPGKLQSGEEATIDRQVAAAAGAVDDGDMPEYVREGTSVMIIDQALESMVPFLGRLKEGTEAALFSRLPPDQYPSGSSLEIKKRFWLSSTPGEGNISPTSLQDISMESEVFLSEKEGRMIILDGLDYLLANNGMAPVKKLMEVLHEKVIVKHGILVFRCDSGLEPSVREVLRSEANIVIDTTDSMVDASVKEKKMEEIPAGSFGQGGDIDVFSDLEGALKREDLEWMCDVLNLPVDGSDRELLERIVEHESSISPEREPGTFPAGKSARDLLESALEAREENEKLKRTIMDLESKLRELESGEKRGKGRKRKKKGRGMILEWEDEGKRQDSDKRIEDIAAEVRMLKERALREEQDLMGGAHSLREIMEKMEEDRRSSIDKIDAVSMKIKDELERFERHLTDRSPRETDEHKGPGSEKDRGKQEKLRGKETPRLPPSRDGKVEPTTPLSKRKRVLKKGEEAVAVAPRIGSRAAMEAAKKNVRRYLFKGPKEHVTDLTPFFLPLYRVLVGYRSGIFRGMKEGDIYIDATLGEVVTGSRNGLNRSKGLVKLAKLTDMECRVFRALSFRKGKDDMEISKRSSLSLKEVRRALTSLRKKGISDISSSEGGVKLHVPDSSIRIISRPWSRDSDIHPDLMENIEEPLLEPTLDGSLVEKMIHVLSDEVKIHQMDVVFYPFYMARITGEGRNRFIIIDGFSGKIDRDLSTVSRELAGRIGLDLD